MIDTDCGLFNNISNLLDRNVTIIRVCRLECCTYLVGIFSVFPGNSEQMFDFVRQTNLCTAAHRYV